MSGDDVLGALGQVTVPIPLDGMGEVMLSVRGGFEAFAAMADQPIEKHTKVVVVDTLSGRTVVVVPF
jgi:membrane-bound ClpP family serine protease